MIIRQVAFSTLVGLLLASVPHTRILANEHKLALKSSMLLNEVAVGDPAPLIDEQDAVGDPASGKAIAPKNPFFPGWQAWAYPVHVAIDLGAAHRVTRVFFYNETGRSEIIVSTGTPFKWQAKPVALDAYRGWVEVPLNVETRWLRVTLPKPVSLPEMVVYGDAAPLRPVTSPALPRIARLTRPTMDELIGANVFIDDPRDKIAAVCGIAREYHNWSWDMESADYKRRFQPSGAAGGSAWFFDDYYRELKQRGVTVSPAIQNSIPGLFGGAKAEYKPVPAGHDPEDPASYSLHAAHLYQFAARYGTTPVEDSRIELAPGQPRKSGLGLLSYIENWNEPDRTWNDRQGRFHPYELAAMSSADRDGHQGKLGASYGVKSADRKMKLVLGGLAGLDLPYLRAMKFWADYNRGGSFPADVINLHHYSSNGNEQGFKPNGHGISPEEDRLRERMAEIITWRNANVPGAEVWLTEFGYDTNPASPLHAPAIGSMTAEQVQAAWIVRSYLALAAAGVDRAAMFMLRDVNSAGGGVFETCGLVTEKGTWAPKPSYYYVVQVRKWLKGYRFAAEVPSGKPDVRIYRFETPVVGKVAYAVWCTSSDNRQVKGFRLPVRATSAIIGALSPTGPGAATTAASKDGAVILDVTETPVFVTTVQGRP